MTETKDEDIQKLYDWTCYAHLALIRGIFTSCRSCVMAIYRWSSVFRHGNYSPIHLSHHALSELFSIAEVLHVAVILMTACPLMRMILFDGSYV